MIRLHSFTRKLVLVFGLIAVLVAPVHAGGSADCRYGVERYGETAIRDLALRLNDALDARKVNVAIVARAGRPRSQLPPGVSYTHVAFVVFEPVRGADGKVFYTYTMYNLYQGPKGHETTSYLKQDLTYDFVAGVLERDVAVCVPVEALQKRLIAVIRSPLYRELHIRDYNLAANPWVDRYDNCVTHMLKVCVAALYQTDDRRRIYSDIRAYFRPTPIHLGLLQSLGSGFVPELRFDDEDPAGLQTATYDSLAAFLRENGLVKEEFTVAISASVATSAATTAQ
jgi:hypothetical protein